MTTNASVTLGAVGDIAFYSQIGDDIIANGLDWPFARIKAQLDRADLLFGNMESVAIPDTYPTDQADPDGLISKITGQQSAELLTRAGFDFMNLAANHILDAGTIGMTHTQKTLEAAGLATAGVGNTQADARKLRVLQRNGLTFGFLCYCEDTNYTLSTTGPCHAYYTLDAVLEDVERHKHDVDILVVSIHADIEFMPTPSMPRRTNFRTIAQAGADIILGHHPHVPQGIERVGKSLVAYSLGNCLFPAHTSSYMKGNGPHTAHSFILLVDVDRNGVRSFERVPFEIAEPPEQRPATLTGPAAQQMLDYLAQLDAHLADDAFVRQTWRDVAKRHLGLYIKRAAERDIDYVLEDLVGRLCFTAENRSWMDEILAMAHEHWQAQQQQPNPTHRPHHRMTAKKNTQP